MPSFLWVGWFCFGHMAVGYMLSISFCLFFLILALQLTQAHSFPEHDGMQLDKHDVTKI